MESGVLEMIAVILSLIAVLVAVWQALIALAATRDAIVGEKIKRMYAFSVESLECMKLCLGKSKEEYIEESYTLDSYSSYVTLLKPSSCFLNLLIDKKAQKAMNEIREIILSQRKKIREETKETKDDVKKVSQKDINDFRDNVVMKIRSALIKLEE